MDALRIDSCDRHRDRVPLAVRRHEERGRIVNEGPVADLESEVVVSPKEEAVTNRSSVGFRPMVHDYPDGTTQSGLFDPGIHREVAGADVDGRIIPHFHIVIHTIETKTVGHVTAIEARTIDLCATVSTRIEVG